MLLLFHQNHVCINSRTTPFYFKMLLSKNFASLIKSQESTLVKLVKLRQSDSWSLKNLFHEHVSQQNKFENSMIVHQSMMEHDTASET